MPRAYLRLDPEFDERKADYPDGPYAALVATLCLAEHQPQRGRFRNAGYLRALLGRRGRFVPYLIEHGDLVAEPGGRLYVDGWDEWQEGDWKVAERVARIRSRDKKSGAQRTADWRLRSKIFERDGYTCRYCGVTDYPREWLVLEHVVPVTQGGPTTEGNLVTSCRGCNHKKGNRTPDEAGMPLRDVPTGDASPTAGDVPTGRDALLERSGAVAVSGGGALAVAEQSAPDDEIPEMAAVQWLARHKVILQPHDGYYRHLLMAVERHGSEAVLAVLEELHGAGMPDGDTKGYVFGVRDELDRRKRPNLRAVEKGEDASRRTADWQRRVERTKVRAHDNGYHADERDPGCPRCREVA